MIIEIEATWTKKIVFKIGYSEFQHGLTLGKIFHIPWPPTIILSWWTKHKVFDTFNETYCTIYLLSFFAVSAVANPLLFFLQVQYMVCYISTFGMSLSIYKYNWCFCHTKKDIIDRKSPIKSWIWKSGKFCFVSQVSNDFQLIDLVTENFVHCSYFDYNIVSEDEI
jgi:hypothetical protein